MKVLLLVHSLGSGGAERVTATLANYWAREGREVVVVTLASRDCDRYALDATIRRIDLNLAMPSTGTIGAVRTNWLRASAIRRVIKNEKPAVAIAMMSTLSVLLALSTIGLFGLTRIGTERTYPPRLPLGAAWERMRALTYGWLDAIVVLTNESRDWVRANTSARTVVVIPNPVTWPLAGSEPRVDPASVGDPNRKRLLTVGRLGEEKRYLLLISTFASLSTSFPDWELVIVGDGPQRGELQEKIAELNLESRVFLPGYTASVGEWYASADLYVLTSRFEGFPNALAEAMAEGVPAVSVDCDTGPRELIRHERDGLLVPQDDREALELALSRLMKDDAQRQTFGMRAADVRTRFKLDAISAQWTALFHRVSPGEAAVPSPLRS